MIISDINKGNKALEYIEKRVESKDYRGKPSSEHNRYDMKKIHIILTLLDKYAPNKEIIAIRTADISKRPHNTPEEYTYAEFCNEAKEKTDIGTQDAMRKNLFVDLHRMGFICRYGANKKPTDPFKKQTVKYVSLTDQGLKLVKAKNILDRYFIFSKGIDDLVGGYIDIVINILREENGIDRISVYEYMFFVSAIGVDYDFKLTTNEAVELITEYRKLTPIQKKSVIETLRVKLNPKNYNGNKTKKRDFHNWKNKIDQIYYLLNQTVYFEVREDKLVLKSAESTENEDAKKLYRSLNEKYQYFVNHEVSKTSGFELHHVVPLAWSENLHHFKMLDRWENMVYIDAFSHAKITQNRNRNVVMGSINNDFSLKDYSNNEVYLRYKDNVLYKLDHKDLMLNYNKELLETVR